MSKLDENLPSVGVLRLLVDFVFLSTGAALVLYQKSGAHRNREPSNNSPLNTNNHENARHINAHCLIGRYVFNQLCSG